MTDRKSRAHHCINLSILFHWVEIYIIINNGIILTHVDEEAYTLHRVMRNREVIAKDDWVCLPQDSSEITTTGCVNFVKTKTQHQYKQRK